MDMAHDGVRLDTRPDLLSHAVVQMAAGKPTAPACPAEWRRRCCAP
jgi:hypothetical protein